MVLLMLGGVVGFCTAGYGLHQTIITGDVTYLLGFALGMFGGVLSASSIGSSLSKKF